MKNILFLTFIASLSLVSSVHSITFSSSKLNDSNSPAYLGFKSKFSQCRSSSEKIFADFNNDTHLDVLSLGGSNQCYGDYEGVSLNLELNLFKDGDYIYHETEIPYSSNFVNVVDIDKDNYLDIVLSNGKVALNDGHAKFTIIEYDESILSLDYFFSVDINQDGFIDIITNNNMYINDGKLNFNKTENTQALNSGQFAVAHLDGDNIPDMLINNNDQLQTWINNGQGQFELMSSIEIDSNNSIIKAIDLNSDGSDEFILSFIDSDVARLKLINNDGQGNLSIRDFDLSPLTTLDNLTFEVHKIYNQDADNDGDSDVWISASYITEDINCTNYHHHLFMIYENTNDGQLTYKHSLHSIGFQQEGTFPFFDEPVLSLPTLIDLNQDNLLDVMIFDSENSTWLHVSPFEFEYSNRTSIKVNKNIQAVDYNKDGNVDILSSGIYQPSSSSSSSSCEIEFTEFPDDISSTTSVERVYEQLWLGDGNGEFSPMPSGSSGFDFNDRYANIQLVDLDQNGDYELLYRSFDPNTNQLKYYYQESPSKTPLIISPPGKYTIRFDVADLDNDGIQEIILLSFVNTEFLTISVLKKISAGFEEIDIITGSHISEFKLADIDGDGKIDIILNRPFGVNSLSILYNNGNGGFSDLNSYAQYVNAFSYSDFNGDSLLDIIYYGYSDGVQIMLNQGQRNFVHLDYDNEFWYSESADYSTLGSIAGFDPEDFKFRDMNNDGKDDLLIYDLEGNIQVFINNSSKTEVSFYKIYRGKVSGQPTNIAMADFNNDGLMDFANGSYNNIKINTQTAIEVPLGLHYNNNNIGHGFSIEDVGRDNLFYSLFYSYDDEGNPEWYSALSRHRADDDLWYLGNVEYDPSLFSIYNYDSNSATLEDTAGDYSRINLFKYRTGSSLNTVFDVDDNQIIWPLNEIISSENRPVNDLSGIWWAGAEDSGWGISLEFLQTEGTQTIVAILYFYDDNGLPRWLIGQAGDFELNQEITVNMNQVNGYGRNQNFVELTQIPAGTITFNLNMASKDFTQAGTMSMDVFYPQDQSDNDYWVRDNIPIALFSKPRD